MTAMMVGGNAFGGSVGNLGRGAVPLSSPPASDPQRLPSPHSPSSPASNESPTSPTSPGRAKACGVCGDIAKSMHFGGLSCDSCKAFFRRSVQNNAHRGFTCPYERKCVIAVSSRKSCQYCRFHKCLSIGMEKGWVMTEEERRKMMQQRQEKKHKEEEKKKMTQMNLGEKYSLSDEDSTEISIIVSLYKKAYQDVPYEDRGLGEGSRGVMTCWMTFCKRIGYFFSLFREFAELPSSDQALLLKTAITSACIIMGSVVYDSKTGQWPSSAIKRPGYIPNVTSNNVQQLVPDELMNRLEQFFKKFQVICPDETMAMILILVALYSSELMGLKAKDTIQALQDRYIRILHKYVGWKYKEQSTLMFPKLIVSLADIRELAERTCQMRIQQSMTKIPVLATIMTKPSDAAALPTVGSPMETNDGEDGVSGGAIGGIEVHQSGADDIECVQVKQECELQSDGALQTEAAYKRARLEATGGVKDHTYQKIMQVMDQMHGSSIQMHVSSLLPFIMQIVKKVGAGNATTTSDKPAAGGGNSSNNSSSTGGGGGGHKSGRGQHSKHHHHHHHHYRPSSRRRTVEVKQERVDEDTDSQDVSSPLSLTTTMSPGHGLHPSPPPMPFSPQLQVETQSTQPQPQQFQSQPQQLQPQLPSPHHQHHLPHSPSLPHSQHFVHSSPQPPLNYPASPMESTDSCDPLLASPVQPPTSPDILLPLPSTHTIPLSPYTPPSATPSPSMPHGQPTTVLPMADISLSSPVDAPSPYSDTSSSSPESSQSPLYELFSQELSKVEVDVLTELLDCVSKLNFENLDNVDPLKDILPPHLLSELQTKLCDYSLKPE